MITYTESTGGSGGYTTIQEEGTSLPQRTTVDFVGAGATATDNGTKTIVTIPIQPAYSTIQDEGSALTQRSIMDFVGTGVTVTDSGTKTTITINGGTIVSLLNSAMLSLITAGTVVVGQFYLITDATYSNGGGVLVQGVTTKSITRSGAGLFWNADYQGVGNYSSVIPSYVQNKGIWGNYLGASAVIGDTVIWDNRNYVNITGNWGFAPNTDAVNWQLLSYSATQGYIFEVDFVLYDVTTNDIIYRADKRNNEVDLYNNLSDLHNTLNDFQWGRDVVTYNKIKGKSDSLTTNSSATFTGNILENAILSDVTPNLSAGTISYNVISSKGKIDSGTTSGVIDGNIVSGNSSIIQLLSLDSTSFCSNNIIEEGSTLTFSTTLVNSTVSKNILVGGAQVSSTTFTSANNLTLTNGYFSNLGVLTFTSVLTATITGCQVSDQVVVDLGATLNSATYTNKKVYKGYSNWEAPSPLELTNPAIYNSGTSTLTIPSSLAYVGIFIIAQSSGSVFSSLANAPTNHNFTLRPSSSSIPYTFRIVPVGISTATTNNIIESGIINAGGLQTYTARLNGCDEAILGLFGNLVGLQLQNIWV